MGLQADLRREAQALGLKDWTIKVGPPESDPSVVLQVDRNTIDRVATVREGPLYSKRSKRLQREARAHELVHVAMSDLDEHVERLHDQLGTAATLSRLAYETLCERLCTLLERPLTRK